MNADLLQGFYLGDLLIEPLKGKVTLQGGSRHLPPKATEVLLCLARKSGELVARESLLECAWGPGKGSHEALSHAVSEIRLALDDHADDPVFIQTMPRHGYRLVVEPELPGEHAESVVIGAKGGTSVHEISLFENLQRRGVLETGLAYLIVGWLIIQVADVVFAQLHFPPWSGTFVTVLVIAGFPIALVLSWYLEFRHGRAVLDQLSPAAARRRRFGRTYISVVGSLAIAGVMVAIYDQIIGLPEGKSPAAAAPEFQLPPIVENSLAVLPFVNLDGSKETQIFADGLVDDVITNLSRVPGLRVASRGDSYSLAPNTPSQEVRDRLRVELYLEGSVEMNADEMRVTVQLINAEDGFHVLSRRFDRPREDFFDLRDEITGLAVANIRVALPPDVIASSTDFVEEPSLDAYVLYRQGVEASRQPTSIDSVASALGWFDAALNVDPGYAVAYAGKCAAYITGYGEENDPDYIAKAQSSCTRALALNPNLDTVHTSLGNLRLSTGRHEDAKAEYLQALANDPSNVQALTGLGETYQKMNRPDKAEASLQQAVDIHPGNASSYNILGNYLFHSGRYADAVEQYQYAAALEPRNMRYIGNLASAYMLNGDYVSAAPLFQRAIDIKPTQSTHTNLGLMHYYIGNFEEAIANMQKAVELQPNDHLARSNLGDVLWNAGREADARTEFEMAASLAQSALDVNPNDPFLTMDMSWIQAMLGDNENARRLIDKTLELAPDDPYSHYYDALIHLRAGDREAALVALERAVDRGYSKKMMAAEPHLAALSSDRRFQALVN